MITQAEIVFSTDGAAMVTLSRTGMDLSAETVVALVRGELRVGQAGQWFVRAAMAPQDAEALQAAREVEIVEVDELGFEFHERVRRA